MKTLALILLLLCGGCTLVTNDRVFPKLTWYWSAEAKQQRQERQQAKPAPIKPDMSNRTNGMVRLPEPPGMSAPLAKVGRPSPPGEGESTSAMVAGATIPVITNVVTAKFEAQPCSYAFFDASADLLTWRRVATYDYPTNGGWLLATNVFKGRVQFYRAGLQ